MIASVKNFFNAFIAPQSERSAAEAEKTLQIASAALLLEMMRMDKRVTADEQASVTASLQAQFGLAPQQLNALLALADSQAQQASGYYEFTSLINTACSLEQKIRIIENMWRVALADGHLDVHEEHLMRKIASLLYVGHADYIAAKLRARDAAGRLVPPTVALQR